MIRLLPIFPIFVVLSSCATAPSLSPEETVYFAAMYYSSGECIKEKRYSELEPMVLAQSTARSLAIRGLQSNSAVFTQEVQDALEKRIEGIPTTNQRCAQIEGMGKLTQIQREQAALVASQNSAELAKTARILDDAARNTAPIIGTSTTCQYNQMGQMVFCNSF